MHVVQNKVVETVAGVAMSSTVLCLSGQVWIVSDNNDIFVG